MANGDTVSPKFQHEYQIWELLADIGATSTGAWADTRVYGDKGVLDISGITTATLQVYGSNDETQPADASDGRQIGSDIIADAIFDLGTLPSFVKVKISAWTSGTIRANLKAYRPNG